MAKLELSVAVGIYDRTFSIFDGRSPMELPPEIDLQLIPANRMLCDMLATGELDAIFSARGP